MSKYDLSSLRACAEEEIKENEIKNSKSNNGYPLVYPINNGTIRLKLLFNPKSMLVQRKVIRHTVGKNKIPCLSLYGEDCPICNAIKSAEDEHGKDCGAWSKYGSKTRGICFAVLVDHDNNMFNNDKDPNKGDTILFMYPPTLYNKINEIIVKSGAHLEDLVTSNEGKTIEVTRKQKNGGFPDYDVSVYAYGDEKVKETDEEFDELLDSLPDISDQIAPKNVTEELIQQARAAEETINSEYSSNKIMNPNNPPEESVNNETRKSYEDVSNIADDNLPFDSTSGGDKPDCFGHHSDEDQKCLICPMECDCMIS